MKNFHKIFTLILLTSQFLMAEKTCAQTNEKKKNILVIATGGTISGSAESQTSSEYSSSKIGIEDLIKKVPKITDLANISAIQLMQVSSQNMTEKHWLKIAQEAQKHLDKKDVDGLVITHGTDTMEETAYFLHLTLKTKKPVVITGAMRSSTSISADGSLNLFNAIATASSVEASQKGVLIVMNDEIYSARNFSKNHTTNLAAFKSLESAAIGLVNYGKVRFYFTPTKIHTYQSEFDIRNIKDLERVDIIYSYAGSDEKIIDFSLSNNAKAIVIAGVGDGNFSDEFLQKLSLAAKENIAVIRSSRVNAGAVIANAEINDELFNFISADNLNPQKARILAMLALTKTKDLKKVRKFFEVM